MGGPASGNYKRPKRSVAKPSDDALDPVDQLRQAQSDFRRFGAVTREDRIALASRFVREWSKHLEQMEAMVDIAELGLPPPTTDEQQASRLARLMVMVGKHATDLAYEEFLVQWREREKYKPHRYRVGKPSEPPDLEPRSASDDGQQHDADSDLDHAPQSGGVPELQGATSDLRNPESPQPEVEAGTRHAASEDRVPRPVVWETPVGARARGSGYIESEDATEEPDF
jgi:hypothetical protein